MFTKVDNDLISAMKSGDKFELSVLRMLKSALKNEEINKKSSLTDDEVLSIIKKQVKLREDSKAEYTKYERKDIADNLEKEIEVLSKYLPKELSEEELTIIVNQTIEEVNPTSMKDMGTIIKAVGAKCGVSANMGLVSSMVKEKLNNMNL